MSQRDLVAEFVTRRVVSLVRQSCCLCQCSGCLDSHSVVAVDSLGAILSFSCSIVLDRLGWFLICFTVGIWEGHFVVRWMVLQDIDTGFGVAIDILV